MMNLLGCGVLGGAALFLQGLYLPWKPFLVLLAVLAIALRRECSAALCWGWLLGLLWGLMAGLPPLWLGIALGAAAAGTEMLHRYLIFTPARLAIWAGLLVIFPAIVLQCFQTILPQLVFTVILAPLTLWGAP